MWSTATRYFQVMWASQILDQKSAKNALTMTITCELPSVVIVASGKLYSE